MFGLKMGSDGLVLNTFDNTLHSFRAFEACQRKDGEDILDFFNRWKGAYKTTEQHGCWMNDTVLALKLLCASGLEEYDAIKVLNSSRSMRLDLIMSALWNLERRAYDGGVKCLYCDMRFLDTEGSGANESVRIHLGEVHMEEELLKAVEDRFGKEGKSDCYDCPGIRLDTSYLRREHLLEAHPWLQLSLVEDQVCRNVQQSRDVSLAEEAVRFDQEIGILSKLPGITVERTVSTKRSQIYSKLKDKNVKRFKHLESDYLMTQDCILCNVNEGKKMKTTQMLLHYSGCLFEQGYFSNIIDPGSDNLNERRMARDVFGKVFRYKCNEQSCPKYMSCQDKCRTVKCRSDCKNSMGFKEFCIHAAIHHNLLEMVMWEALPDLPGLMVVLKVIQSAERKENISGKVLPPKFTREELHTCLLCEGREKEGEKLLLDSRDFRLLKYHYASCYFPTGVYLNLYPPGKINMVGSVVRDLLGQEVTYACNQCEKRKRMGYKAFAIHMASEHGGLDMVMLLDKRKEVRRFARRIGLGNDQSTQWWQGLRQLDQFRRRNERLQKTLQGAKNDKSAISSVIQELKLLLEDVAWSDTDIGGELMARKEEMITDLDNLIEANIVNTEDCQ